MDKIRKLNLEIALFTKELNSYIENGNSEINDETIKLLIETIESANKLQKISKFHERSSTNESSFINSLNDDIFKCRRYVVCCLCHEQFPLTSEDFVIHNSKRGHKERDIEHSIESASNLVQSNSLIPAKPEDDTSPTNTTSDDQCFNNAMNNDESASTNIVALKREKVTENLANIVASEKISISRNIASNAVDLIFRSVQRISIEAQILELLSRHLKTFDLALQIMPFGSATYGFGGPRTDFNILVVAETDAGNENSHEAQSSFERFFYNSDLQTDFQALNTIPGDRAQNRRLHAVHKSSATVCWIHFDSTFEAAKSSQIIRNCILHSPVCYHLVAYLKSWQNALNESAAKSGLSAIQFNTYIVSVLVIFFLQLNDQFPKIASVPATEMKSIDCVPHLEKEKFKSTVVEFFKFYSNKYQAKNHVISANIGHWKNRTIGNKQSNLTPEEERLRAGIELNASNWENCSMYIQDLVSPGINIAAEVSEEEANSFKQMCTIFASASIRDQTIDEYLTTISEERSAYMTITLGSNVSSTHAVSNLKPSTIITSADLKLAVTKNLEDIIKADEITKRINIEMNEIETRTASRTKSEQDIVKLLTFFMTTYVPNVKFMPFGSTTYGFGGASTDFNILFSSATFGDFKQHLENLLKVSNEFKKEFESLNYIKANRVRNDHLIVRHIKSGIQCSLQLATKSVLHHAEQAKMLILNYLSLHPLCKQLIAYVKAWQNTLNKEAFKHGLEAFNMNLYTIAVLVIFYLQMNHKLPKAKDASVTIKKPKYSINGDLNQLKKGFFEFYGKSFNCNTHIISIHVGKWQQKVQDNQKHLTAEQKSMREGIKASPKNWINCTMCVQDIISARINIAAEIPKHEVDNFVRMCQMFAKPKPNTGRSSQNMTTMTLPKTISSQSNTPILNSAKNLNSLVKLLEKEVTNICLPSTLQLRQHFESEIFSMLQLFLHEFDSSLKLYAFGSSQYGVKLPGSNYNLMIVTASAIKTLKIATQLFLSKFGQSSISGNFNELRQISANRVMSSQISMTHIKSGINCVITFDTDQTIIESTKIIAHFTKDPLCNILICFLRLLLDALQRSNILNFEFNTYTISILVIFFLQVEHKYPTVEQVVNQRHSIPSKALKFKQAMKEFFKFYGKRYQPGNQVISANIGQWQERLRQPKQKLSAGGAKERLRVGITSSPENWKNCAMCVQDVVRPNVNVTAEISKEAVEIFQIMCGGFANGQF